jgi:protein-tyrosine-phosphatase
MAEFVLKDMVEEICLQSKFNIKSSATSTEEIGSPVHHGTRKILNEHGISCEGKTAIQLTKKDYEDFDYIIAMLALNGCPLTHSTKQPISFQRWSITANSMVSILQGYWWTKSTALGRRFSGVANDKFS